MLTNFQSWISRFGADVSVVLSGDGHFAHVGLDSHLGGQQNLGGQQAT